MKQTLCTLALASSFAIPSVSQAGTADQETITKAVTPGASTSSVLESLGQPDRIEYVSEKPVWVYPYTEERFGPDINGEIKAEITEQSTVGKVFNDQGGLGVWAISGLIFLAIVFI